MTREDSFCFLFVPAKGSPILSRGSAPKHALSAGHKLQVKPCACVCFLEFNARHGRRSVAKCLLLGHLRFCLEALLPCFCDEHFFARSPVPKCPKPGSSVIGRSSISFQRDCRRQPRAHFTLRTLRGCCKQEEKLCSGQAAAGDMSLRSTWDDSSTESCHAAIPVLHATSHLKRERVLHRAGRLRHFLRHPEGQKGRGREKSPACVCPMRAAKTCRLPQVALHLCRIFGNHWQRLAAKLLHFVGRLSCSMLRCLD